VSLLEAFLRDPNAEKLDRRRDGFAAIMAHLDSSKPGWILETGVSREPDNYSGDGMSTAWWDWVIARLPEKFEGISFDINPTSCEWARTQFSRMKVWCGDSVSGLSVVPAHIVETTRLLYLDSFDWSLEKNLDSAFHHFKELATVYARLPSGCLIVVDDRHDELFGKHGAVTAFFQNLGVSPIFVGYQIGWIKP